MLIEANYYSLTPRRFIAGTRNSYGFETLDFEFSSEWADLNKTVTFYPADGSTPVGVIYTGSPVTIPAEATAAAGLAKYTLSGYIGSTALFSVTGFFDVIDANNPVADIPLEPTPSELAQLLALTNTAVEVANSVRDDADAGEFDGEQGPRGVPGAGFPAGGSAGQVLAKSGNADYATVWKTPTLTFTNITASVWSADLTYSGYSFKCVLSLPGVTSDMYVEVVFGHNEAISGNYSPVCHTGNGSVTIFSKFRNTITIPTIKAVCI